ncbi:hypothetical protein BDEG_27342 [Batrachochytrium dendrobatidis JEL423]|uniref:Uncharacterized protein n=1 Tax=Batrachochytrium dendrobatidis (strain JEL423) TaxID=403673 RepID=A0A177WX35_BATDL|nr:hypothetical protein BDEG_27342 [Batrachochytrium dendrobatidis JEL423]
MLTSNISKEQHSYHLRSKELPSSNSSSDEHQDILAVHDISVKSQSNRVSAEQTGLQSTSDNTLLAAFHKSLTPTKLSTFEQAFVQNRFTPTRLGQPASRIIPGSKTNTRSGADVQASSPVTVFKRPTLKTGQDVIAKSSLVTKQNRKQTPAVEFAKKPLPCAQIVPVSKPSVTNTLRKSMSIPHMNTTAISKQISSPVTPYPSCINASVNQLRGHKVSIKRALPILPSSVYDDDLEIQRLKNIISAGTTQLSNGNNNATPVRIAEQSRSLHGGSFSAESLVGALNGLTMERQETVSPHMDEHQAIPLQLSVPSSPRTPRSKIPMKKRMLAMGLEDSPSA